MLASVAMAGHQGEIGDMKCTTCHDANLVNEHGGFDSFSCWRCHASQDPIVMDTIAAGKVGYIVLCSNCHGETGHLEKHDLYLSQWMEYSGVMPGPAGKWTQVTDFTLVDPAAREYQLCLKCHSANVFGIVPDGITEYIGPSGDPLTDQAMEFNPANKAAHPVEVPSSQQIGSSSPRSLVAGQLKAPWNTAVGNQTMDCGDCHGVDDQARFLLKDIDGSATRVYWPERPDGNLWTLRDVASNRNDWQNKLFCVNCHPIKSSRGGFMNGTHGESDHYEDSNGGPCVICHSAVPHGSKRSRFIVYADEPAPYNYKGNTAVIRGFKKATRPGDYDEENCYFPDRSGCSDHEDRKLTYDP